MTEALTANMIQVAGQFVFGALFVWLFKYTLQKHGEREDWLRSHLEKADTNLEQVTTLIKLLKNEICDELYEMKHDIHHIDEKVESIDRKLKESRLKFYRKDTRAHPDSYYIDLSERKRESDRQQQQKEA